MDTCPNANIDPETDPHCLINRNISPGWRSYLAGLQDYLESGIAGQSGALLRISRAIQSAELGLNSGGNRAKASFYFWGQRELGRPNPQSALLNTYSVPARRSN